MTIIIYSVENFYTKVQAWTEKQLTKRKAIKLYKKTHKTVKTEILSWIDAILFAVCVVFILNQVLFQLFVIPSPSMQDTMLIGDKVFVSKNTYGIEVYPYGPKIFDKRTPDRDDIITFYNPQYESKGPLFSTLSKIVFMATFGMVNIEVDDQGNPGEWLLVKRAAALPGDTVKFIDGDAYIKPAGTGTFVKESTFRLENLYNTNPKREIKEETYNSYKALGRLNGITSVVEKDSLCPQHLIDKYQKTDQKAFYSDYYQYEKEIAAGTMCANPADSNARSDFAKKTAGIYVPKDNVLPLGDNRDNSSDGRYFGPVNVKTINGHVCSVISPLKRAHSFVNEK